MNNICIGCYGRLGWYSEDNGQCISCLNCKEGKERYEKDQENIKISQEICNKSLIELRKTLNASI